MPGKKRYVIIGSGIVGASIARELAEREAGDIVVLEKEDHLGEHGSGRNSGVLHSGINQKPGSLKARMAVEGNRRAREFCERKGVLWERCGTIVLGRDDREKEVIRQVMDMGNEAGVEGLRIIDRDELSELEPSVVSDEALLSPNGSIVDSAGFLEAVVDEAKELGAQFVMSAPVTAYAQRGNQQAVVTPVDTFPADHIINAAGLHADTIAHMMDAGKEYTVIPFRGDYLEITDLPINSMVYQAPDLRYPFLGVHFTKTVDNDVLAGPTATISFGREAYDKGIRLGEAAWMMMKLPFWKLVLSREFMKLAVHNAKVSFIESAFLDEVLTMTPDVKQEDIKPFRSGIRAQMVDKAGKMVTEFIVEYYPTQTHVLNAVSPGMTSALAFAENVVDKILEPESAV
jgi:(S)-2-hydroxyglutarate dehydrogenase